ncbi:MAG: hypothetical protein AB7T32_17545 [Dehalococcoidia bacterium]
MDEQTPRPAAWLRFGVDGPEAIFLSDRTAWSARHREHTWSSRGSIVGSDELSNRYLVAAIPLDTTELRTCDVCGEPNALLVGAGMSHVLYSGPELEIAERIFAEAFE